MVISIKPDVDGMAIEACCFCRTPAAWWTDLEDRTPGQQVAICLRCAAIHSPSSVPSKRDWCESERKFERKRVLY